MDFEFLTGSQGHHYLFHINLWMCPSKCVLEDPGEGQRKVHQRRDVSSLPLVAI